VDYYKTGWIWFEQANIVYSEINKDITFHPNIGHTVYDWLKDELIHIQNEEILHKYIPMNKTIPITLTENGIETYESFQQEDGYDTNEIYKLRYIDICIKDKLKCENDIWMENIEMIFIGFKKDEKFTLQKIFKNMIKNENPKPNWTEKQSKWIKKKGINLKRLLSINIKTISRIDDFRRKFFMNYWYRLRLNKCPVCKSKTVKLSVEHILLDCNVVKRWEIKVYGERTREKRKKAFWDSKDINHTSSWIYNWCIWKNIWDIRYEKKLKLDTIKKQSQNLKKYIKLNKFIHLKLIIDKRSNSKPKKKSIKDEISLFKFYKLPDLI